MPTTARRIGLVALLTALLACGGTDDEDSQDTDIQDPCEGLVDRIFHAEETQDCYFGGSAGSSYPYECQPCLFFNEDTVLHTRTGGEVILTAVPYSCTAGALESQQEDKGWYEAEADLVLWDGIIYIPDTGTCSET